MIHSIILKQPELYFQNISVCAFQIVLLGYLRIKKTLVQLESLLWPMKSWLLLSL